MKNKKEIRLIPFYQVEAKTIKKGFGEKHLYTVKQNDEVIGEYQSVTKFLDLLDDGKSGALSYWGRKVAFENIKSELFKRIDAGENITKEVIEELSQVAFKTPDKIKDEAADIGTQCHNAIDAFIKNEPIPTLTDEALQAYQNFLSWIQDNQIHFISGDIPVASIKYEFGGRPDALAERDGEIILFDWKTSNAIRTTYFMQVAAYAIGIEETYGLKVDRAYIVRFSKNSPEVEIVEAPLPQGKEAFLTILKLSQILKGIKEGQERGTNEI